LKSSFIRPGDAVVDDFGVTICPFFALVHKCSEIVDNFLLSC